jgi:hypothetical protein
MDPPSLSCGEQGVIDKAMVDRLQMDANYRDLIRVHFASIRSLQKQKTTD